MRDIGNKEAEADQGTYHRNGAYAVSENGKNGYTKWLVGTLFTVLFWGFTTLASNVIANDKEARQRDEDIKEDMVKVCSEQAMVNQSILITLKEIQTDMKYVRREVAR